MTNQKEPYVEYSSNNSGGEWWLDDEDWYKLEKAGWVILWCKDHRSFSCFSDKNGRWLGALAMGAYKPNCSSVKEAIQEWEDLLNKDSSEQGCPCCGNPHDFYLRENS
jgi:hypothetical protein